MKIIPEVKRFSFRKWNANDNDLHLRTEVRNTVI